MRTLPPHVILSYFLWCKKRYHRLILSREGNKLSQGAQITRWCMLCHEEWCYFRNAQNHDPVPGPERSTPDNWEKGQLARGRKKAPRSTSTIFYWLSPRTTLISVSQGGISGGSTMFPQFGPSPTNIDSAYTIRPPRTPPFTHHGWSTRVPHVPSYYAGIASPRFYSFGVLKGP